MHTSTSTTSVRINKDVIVKLDKLGRFKDTYSSVIDRLASKELTKTRAMEIEKEHLEQQDHQDQVPSRTGTGTGYETPLEKMSF